MEGSAARTWPPLAHFVAAEERLGAWALTRGPYVAGLYEFLRFGVKQAWACLFGGLICALLITSYLFYTEDAGVSRYDALTLAVVGIQIALLWLRMETWEEAKVIALYHGVGTIMEVFKTAVGSWVYPEASVLRLAGVPLFTGFLYASIGSYIARVWRLFDFRFTRHPPLRLTLPLAGAIYLNFFTHHVMWDMRLPLMALSGLLFGRTTVYFKIWHVHRRMPLVIGFLLVTLFIWIAENIGTASRIWLYPNQHAAWAMVAWGKFGSWYLLMIVSYVLVTLVSRPRDIRWSARGEGQPVDVGRDRIERAQFR
ncbi:DUF817 domain-containing protein [Methylobacterium gossipiicola]|uniref:Uncharacterized membrane protein YoaT, DUF817 family n=1 Tax=Methylobacterium gossipiicola TaxID=582675 RepID=A0A1I2QT87_9HYPH|nr:DUF817 domain-containing protein [Methylobacterium gossipiicola]SFG29487.1 Uncharacterized membrane protein YoaT, DUF817 family [Methylobacterium gossipiicola]